MDFLLIVLAIGGLVFAGVMLVLASRATRMQRESDARVHRLQTLATGSVLFAEGPVELGPVELGDEAFELGDGVVQPARPVTVDMTSKEYPFVVTVPAGGGRMPGSFNRTPHRSRT